MSVTTSWIKPAPIITGQDHLGTQAPSVAIYTALLPGITNVTTRARYYTFYPWFLWSYDRRFAGAGPEHLVTMLRRAECLFCLIGARHERTLDEHPDWHGGATVGREELLPALNELEAHGGTLRLSRYATLEQVNERYFQNALGGLGQYYFGPLRDSAILGGDTRTRDLKYTRERGLPLAEAFTVTEADAFFDVLQDDRCSMDQLDALASFCPCGLKSSAREQNALLDFYFDRRGEQGAEAIKRRSTLVLLLDMLGRGKRVADTTIYDEFRASVYSRARAGGEPWDVPDGLRRALQGWGAYQRNELLSLAAQTLFWLALDGVTRARDVATIASGLSSSSASARVADRMQRPLAELVEHARRTLPPLAGWDLEGHEMQTARRLLASTTPRERDDAVAFECALELIVSLYARDSNDDPYESCTFEPGYFDRYPINLRSLIKRGRAWQAMPVRSVLDEFTAWTLNTHIHVAMQKLAASPPRDTFKVKPFDDELHVIEAPPPGYTTPRIHRAVSILYDCGVLENDEDENPRLTKLGEKLLDEVTP